VIRRIFEEIAAGRGFAKIAKGLNADAIPCPRAEYGHRMWAMTGVREMVFGDLYRGRLVWGRTRWVDRRGTKARADVPEADWIVQDAPELRIVSDELWRVAHARLDRTRQSYLRQTGGKLGGRPELESRNLLSGFLVCGECGGSMHAIKRTSKRGAAEGLLHVQQLAGEFSPSAAHARSAARYRLRKFLFRPPRRPRCGRDRDASQ
jgi:site-specific DNA recombinase